jgi:hypothetical protein
MSVPRSRHAFAHAYQAQPASLQFGSEVIALQVELDEHAPFTIVWPDGQQ